MKNTTKRDRQNVAVIIEHYLIAAIVIVALLTIGMFRIGKQANAEHDKHFINRDGLHIYYDRKIIRHNENNNSRETERGA